MKPILCLFLWLCLLPAPRLPAQETKSPAGPDGAQTVLTWAQAVQFALEHSPLLGAARERIAGALGNLQSAKAFPPAEVSIGPSFGGDVGVVPLISQTLETSGRRGPRMGVARGTLTSTQREGDTARLDVIRDVSRVYYDLAQGQQMFALFTEVATIVRRTRDSVKMQADCTDWGLARVPYWRYGAHSGTSATSRGPGEGTRAVTRTDAADRAARRQDGVRSN